MLPIVLTVIVVRYCLWYFFCILVMHLFPSHSHSDPGDFCELQREAGSRLRGQREMEAKYRVKLHSTVPGGDGHVHSQLRSHPQV